LEGYLLALARDFHPKIDPRGTLRKTHLYSGISTLSSA
jgi:hypothetical protein